MVKIGLLDYAQIDEGSHAARALNETIELAKLAEKLNYKRFWVAEHHDVPAFANSSPELLMMRIADATSTIRIGSGGVMIPHYSPYKVAENIRLLEAFHPNRIDLGIGNNSGTPIVNEALNETKARKLSYKQSIEDLVYYLTNSQDESHRFKDILVQPHIKTVPEMFILSTSERSAKISAQLGLGYAFGLFPFLGASKLNKGPEAAHAYRTHFEPSTLMKKPTVTIAPFISIAETNEEAENYAKSLDLWLLGKENFGAFNAFPSVETAEQYNYSDVDRERIKANRKFIIVGDQERVKEQVGQMINDFQADEIIFIPLMPGITARKRAYELLAELYLTN